jgi:hypothetical protein
MSVRHVLENFYDLEGCLPVDVAEKVSPQKPATHSAQSKYQHPEDKAIVTILNDPRITLEQKEKISTSILNGSFEFVANSPDQKHAKPRLIPRDVEKQRVAGLTVQRHQLPKPSFLQVITHATPIPVMSGREARAQKIRVQLQMSGPPPRSPEVPNHFSPVRPKLLPKGFHDSDITDEHTLDEVAYHNSSPVKPSLKELQNQLVAEHTRFVTLVGCGCN